MLWLIESAKNILGLRGPRDGLQEGEGRWEGTTHTKFYREYLPDVNKRYSCVHCQAHLAFHNDIISKSFHGSQGRAYLFNDVVNVRTGPAEERILLTGKHSVADIFCASCKTTLGWKYEFAFERTQKYKEGKFIIETIHMVKDNGWDLVM